MKILNLVGIVTSFIGSVLMAFDFFVGTEKLEIYEDRLQRALERWRHAQKTLGISSFFRKVATYPRWQGFYLVYMVISVLVVIGLSFSGQLYKLTSPLAADHPILAMIIAIVALEVVIPAAIFGTLSLLLSLLVVALSGLRAGTAFALHLVEHCNSRGHVIGGFGAVLFLGGSACQIAFAVCDL